VRVVVHQGEGVRNVVHWRVNRYDELKLIELVGRDDIPGSTFRVIADLSGGLLSTPVGRLVAKVLESDVRKSVSNLAKLR
jgi:hypothetical protein